MADIVVDWHNGVNKRILRNGTSWKEPKSFIEDETRSGKKKRRLMNSMERREFSVAMLFKYEEYVLFKDWFDNTTFKGLYPFWFPQIDAIGVNPPPVKYRFSADGLPSYNNTSGDLISVSMKWEVVDE